MGGEGTGPFIEMAEMAQHNPVEAAKRKKAVGALPSFPPCLISFVRPSIKSGACVFAAGRAKVVRQISREKKRRRMRPPIM